MRRWMGSRCSFHHDGTTDTTFVADVSNETQVGAFRDRSLADQHFPYVFLDATYCKARVDHRVVSQAVVVATGVGIMISVANSGVKENISIDRN